VLRGDITDVAVLHDGGQVFLGLKFTPRGGETLSKWMTQNQQHSIAYVLDGKMLFAPVNIMTPFSEPVKQMEMQVPGDLIAYALTVQFKRALIKAEMRGQHGV
jgi:preprotein translocase subunit SecD